MENRRKWFWISTYRWIRLDRRRSSHLRLSNSTFDVEIGIDTLRFPGGRLVPRASCDPCTTCTVSAALETSLWFAGILEESFPGAGPLCSDSWPQIYPNSWKREKQDSEIWIRAIQISWMREVFNKNPSVFVVVVGLITQSPGNPSYVVRIIDV